MSRTFVIGTRASRLALRQVELVSDALRASAPSVSLGVREVHTEGDRSSAPLRTIGGLGVFTKAIERALAAGEVDIAVHSLKDLPTELQAGLTIGAVPPREDVRDALITRDGRPLAALRSGARIGTGAGRRAVQLLRMRADIEPAEIRGNVETRIHKVEDGAYDGGVFAMAGLVRLGLVTKAAQVFSIDEMLPAVGQGAIAVEVRASDADALALVRAIDDAPARASVEAERAFLRRLGGGCRLPVGAYAHIEDGVLILHGMIAAATLPDDGRVFRGERRGPASAPDALGTQLADDLLAQGAAKFVDPL